MTHRKKLIEVALPLEAINKASVREKSIRHGHPSTLHLWWARRPLAAARAVIFTSLVDDPDDPNALPAFVEACKKLKKGANVEANGDTPRMRLFDFIEQLVTWEATTDEDTLNQARELIQIATEGNPPPLLDPFAGGGSIPLEALRLGLEAHASDLNPVAVMINKAQIEIPPRFADMPAVNPRDRGKMFGDDRSILRGAAGLAADVRYYGEWMREKAFERIGHLYPTHNGETVIAWLWAQQIVEIWLDAHDAGPVFTAMIDGRGDMLDQRTTHKRMTTRSVQRMLKRYPISIDGKPMTVTPHDLRRSYARNLFLAGIPTEVIRQNLGHADVKTTQDYIGVLDGSTRAPVSVYDASLLLSKLNKTVTSNVLLF